MWLRSLWYILTLRCEEADRLRAIGDPQALKPYQRVAERIHRGLCKSCRHAAAQLDRLDRGLSDLAGTGGDEPHPEWTPDRLARLDAAFQRESAGPTDGPAKPS